VDRGGESKRKARRKEEEKEEVEDRREEMSQFCAGSETERVGRKGGTI
jgi:hypothetical protein